MANPPESFSVAVQASDELTVIRVSGELDLANASKLESALEASSAAPGVVIDLGSLEFIDSTGLRVLLAADRRAKERGQSFAVTPGGAQVQRVFSVTGADSRLDFVDAPAEK